MQIESNTFNVIIYLNQVNMKLLLQLVLLSCFALTLACTPTSSSADKGKDKDKAKQDTEAQAKKEVKSSADKAASSSSSSTSTAKYLTAVTMGECSKMKEAEFSCACEFGQDKEQFFVYDMQEAACIGIKGEAQALYPDWEEKDYKAELKKLAASTSWVRVHGDEISYFGKTLQELKYSDPVALLTDVILASGKEMSVVPIETVTGGKKMKKAMTDNKSAIDKAKALRATGGKDPLQVVKFDNRTYDVIVRYVRKTQREGEADDYDARLTLLKHRSNEILETKTLKGYCGC